MRVPSIGLINLGVFAVFMLTAGVGSIVPQLVKDRLREQFRPVWQTLLFTPDAEWTIVGESFAVASQWLVGIAELAAGLVACAALASPARRRVLAHLALGLATLIFGVFMIVLFLLHDAYLPKWDKFPPLLVWTAATWFLIDREITERLGPSPR